MAKNKLSSVLKSLKKFGDEAEKLIEDTTIAVASEIEADAKRLAPVNKQKNANPGNLRQMIFTQKVDKLNYEIVAGAPYSAYMEFGTGGLVNVPEEMKDIAIQFKGNGVKQVNIAPRPFLYPAFIKGRVQYVDDLTDVLNDLTKKYN
jgi:HK97 gp10 family phage protein